MKAIHHTARSRTTRAAAPAHADAPIRALSGIRCMSDKEIFPPPAPCRMTPAEREQHSKAVELLTPSDTPTPVLALTLVLDSLREQGLAGLHRHIELQGNGITTTAYFSSYCTAWLGHGADVEFFVWARLPAWAFDQWAAMEGHTLAMENAWPADWFHTLRSKMV